MKTAKNEKQEALSKMEIRPISPTIVVATVLFAVVVVLYVIALNGKSNSDIDAEQVVSTTSAVSSEDTLSTESATETSVSLIASDVSKSEGPKNPTTLLELDKTNYSLLATGNKTSFLSNHTREEIKDATIPTGIEEVKEPSVDVTEPKEESIILEDYIIPVSEEDINIIVRFVLHEVGNDESLYYAVDSHFNWVDFDLIQQCIAMTVVSRVKSQKFPNTVYEVLTQEGQFIPAESLYAELECFDSYDELTRKNVLTVLEGESVVPMDLYYEMGFHFLDDQGKVVYDLDKIMEATKKQLPLGEIEFFYSVVYRPEERTCVFIRQVAD